MTTFTAPQITEDLVARFEPWLTPDLQTYLEAVAYLLAEVEFYSFDTETAEGWTVLFDPQLAPEEALAYLAQFVGEVLAGSLTEAGKREWIADNPNAVRGTPYSVFLAALRRLVPNPDGVRLVSMSERDPDVDTIVVNTYNDSTPDPDAVEAEIRSVLPADVILDYVNVDGQSWSGLLAGHATWADVDSDYADWNEAATDQIGLTTWER
jgi:hypothetical protein